MPFCANCGAKLDDNAKFCASCGAAREPSSQKSSAPPPPPPYSRQPEMQPVGQANTGESSTGMKANIAGLLCYVFGWVTGIVFLVLEKNSKFVSFNAAQSIVVFGIIIVLNIILSVLGTSVSYFFTILSGLIGLATFILWLILMIKAYQGEEFKVPVLGDIARGIAGK
jgi:uncharacterized membrane protein